MRHLLARCAGCLYFVIFGAVSRDTHPISAPTGCLQAFPDSQPPQTRILNLIHVPPSLPLPPQPPAPLGNRHSSALGDFLSACHNPPKVLNDDSPMTSPTTHDKHTHTVKVDTPGGHTHAIHTRTPSHGHGHKKQNSHGGGGYSRQSSALASGESTTSKVRVPGTCIVSPQEQIDEVRAGLEKWESERVRG